jgi:hypothetical protein
MVPTDEPGTWRSDEPLPVDGHWKTLLRLHRGSEMMAVPVWFPADPTIGEEAIRAEDRTADFSSERRYLLREAADETGGLLSPVIHGLLLAAATLWVAAFAAAVRALQGPDAGRHRRPVPSPRGRAGRPVASTPG